MNDQNKVGPILSDERTAFEAAYLARGKLRHKPSVFVRNEDGYLHDEVWDAWSLWQARATLAAVPGQSEPVRYELCMRAPKGNCGPWAEVQGSVYERFRANPDIGDGFAYETRALYDHAAQPAPVSGATSDELPQGAIELRNWKESVFSILQELATWSPNSRNPLDTLAQLRHQCTALRDVALMLAAGEVAQPAAAAPAGPVVARPDLSNDALADVYQKAQNVRDVWVDSFSEPPPLHECRAYFVRALLAALPTPQPDQTTTGEKK